MCALLSRRRPMAWAQFMLLGHAAIAGWSLYNGLWLIPVMVSLGPFYMGWAFLACNSVQHIGMHHGNAADGTVRICKTRQTITNAAG